MTAANAASAGDRSGKVNFEDPQVTEGRPALPSVEDIMSMGDAGVLEGPPAFKIPAAVFQVHILAISAQCNSALLSQRLLGNTLHHQAACERITFMQR